MRLVLDRNDEQLELVARGVWSDYYVRLDGGRPSRLLLKPKGGAGLYYLETGCEVGDIRN